MSAETSTTTSGVERITFFLRSYNRAIRRGQTLPSVGPPLAPSEQERVERFLRVADPRGLADRELRRRQVQAKGSPSQEPVPPIEVSSSVGQDTLATLQVYLGQLTQADTTETATLPQEGDNNGNSN